MKKRIVLLLMVCAWILSAIPVSAVQPQFSVVVQAEQQEVEVGDTVCFTVVAQGEDVVALQFNIVVPEGMKFVSGSGALSKGLREKLGVAAVDWTEGAMIFTYYNDVGVTIPKDTVLMTFECTAEKAGSYQLELEEVLPFNSEFEEFAPSVKMASVTVVKAGEQGEKDPTVTQPTTPSTDPSTEPSTEPTDASTEPSSDTQPTESSDATEPEATDPTDQDATEATTEDTTEDTAESTQTSIDETEKTTVSSTDSQNGNGSDDAGRSSGKTVLWIVLAVAGVAVATAVVLYLRKKKSA
jgi:hypothetical protein